MNNTDEENEVQVNENESVEEVEKVEETVQTEESKTQAEDEEVKLDDFIDLEKKQLKISLKTFIYIFAIMLLAGALYLLVCLIDRCLTGIASYYETPTPIYIEEEAPTEKEGVILQYHDSENVLIIDEYIGTEVRN